MEMYEYGDLNLMLHMYHEMAEPYRQQWKPGRNEIWKAHFILKYQFPYDVKVRFNELYSSTHKFNHI